MRPGPPTLLALLLTGAWSGCLGDAPAEPEGPVRALEWDTRPPPPPPRPPPKRVPAASGAAEPASDAPGDPAAPTPKEEEKPSGPFTLSSVAFENGGALPAEYTCDGRGLPPPLKVANPPPKAKTIAIVVDAPDVRRGGFAHWIVWNLPANASEIPSEANLTLLGAKEGKNDHGRVGYSPPCPPMGTHRYRFTAYAIRKEIHLERGATKMGVEYAIEKHVLAKSAIVAVYGRAAKGP